MMSEGELKREYRRDPKQFVTRKWAADVLGCSVTSISRYVKQGKLDALRVGNGRLLIYEPSVWNLLRMAS